VELILPASALGSSVFIRQSAVKQGATETPKAGKLKAEKLKTDALNGRVFSVMSCLVIRNVGAAMRFVAWTRRSTEC
jgi:hypothetical protein